MSAILTWGGHRIQLRTLYLPSGDARGQRDFIRTRLTDMNE
jgi:hypothetical protein